MVGIYLFRYLRFIKNEKHMKQAKTDRETLEKLNQQFIDFYYKFAEEHKEEIAKIKKQHQEIKDFNTRVNKMNLEKDQIILDAWENGSLKKDYISYINALYK